MEKSKTKTFMLSFIHLFLPMFFFSLIYYKIDLGFLQSQFVINKGRKTEEKMTDYNLTTSSLYIERFMASSLMYSILALRYDTCK